MTPLPGPEPGGLVLLGHNGAGKTTLLHFLVGLHPHRRAHPFLANWPDIAPLPQDRAIGFVPGTGSLDRQLTGREHLDLVRRWRRVSKGDTGSGDLPEALLDRRVAGYSRGQQQALLLTLALVGDPAVLVLDEPFAGLDPFARDALLERLAALRSDRALILASHDLEAARRLGDRIWILRAGRITDTGPAPAETAALAARLHAHPPDHVLA